MTAYEAESALNSCTPKKLEVSEISVSDTLQDSTTLSPDKMQLGNHIRLLNVKNFQFREYDEGNLPAYAILSHVWYNEEKKIELVYDSFESLPRNANGVPQCPKDQNYAKSHDKIMKTCQETRKLGEGSGKRVDFVWIDSICIDKRNAGERDRAIRSMWRFYGDAACCIVWLQDVEWSKNNKPRVDQAFENARWFSRGWTLQELIAPKIVYFFNRSWDLLGTKWSLAAEITSRTRIERKFLKPEKARSATIAQRLSWAAGRNTTEPEDRVYSLFGLFNVDIEVKYGGPNPREERYRTAFSLMQKEILRDSTDESLFAWRNPSLKSSGLLAPSIDCFKDSNQIVSYHGNDLRTRSVRIDSAGLHFPAPNWKMGQGNVNPGDLAFAAKRAWIRRKGVELDLYCSTKHPETDKVTAVAVKLKHEDGAWKRTDCGNLFYPPKVRFGFWLGRAATAQLHGFREITVPFGDVMEGPDDAASEDEDLTIED